MSFKNLLERVDIAFTDFAASGRKMTALCIAVMTLAVAIAVAAHLLS